jgi:hypothetical protein
VGASAAAGRAADARSTFPRFGGGIPVLLYHRLTPSINGYGVEPVVFEAQMRRLHELGFETVSLDQYVRFIRGEAVDLPPRPVLLTFDDGYLSALRVADPLLARFGWSAAIFVPTGAVGRPGRLTWTQLRQMEASGRWRVDLHAGEGHVLVPIDAAGRRLPFYSSEIWADGKQESFEQYKRRVTGDIERGLAALSRKIPNWSSHGTFAVPFNNYGQHGSNDPRIEAWLSAYLRARFTAVFVQRDDRFTTPGPGLANRIHVPGTWNADTLVTHLVDGHEQLTRRDIAKTRRRT